MVEGGRKACQDAGIPLAGGHSIDAPEPIFGLAVTGIVQTRHLKQNSTATAGCKLYLTKPLGIGILTTAQKRKVLLPEHTNLAIDTMCQMNTIGAQFGEMAAVKALTDVTGFGLGGHLREMCEGSNVQAVIQFEQVPVLPHIPQYLELDCSPGGAQRNFDSYGYALGSMTERQRQIVCDPQTSGGLLVAVDPAGEADFLTVCRDAGLDLQPIGYLREAIAGNALITLE